MTSLTTVSEFTTCSPPKLIGQGYNKLVFESRNNPNKVLYLPKRGCSSSLNNDYQTIEALKKDEPHLRKSKELKDNQELTEFLTLDWEKTEEIQGKVAFQAARALGDLSQYLKEKKLSIKERLSLGKGLLTGVKLLHAAQKNHGDLKPDNVLVYCENGKITAKLSDFGKTVSCSLKEERFLSSGNQLYSPPERSLSQKGEVYSAALILLRIFEETMNPGISKDQSSPKELHGIAKIFQESRKISNLIGKLIYRLMSFFYYLFNIQGKNPQKLPDYIAHVMKNIQNEAPQNLVWEKGVQNLHCLLSDMTKENPNERPESRIALERFEMIQKQFLAAK